MNFNAIIAVLVLKNIITEDDGDRLVKHLNDKPQSTVLKDAIAAVAEVLGKPANVVQAPIGPVGPAQQAEELAARSAVADPPLPEPIHTGVAFGAPLPETDEPAKPTSTDKPKEDTKKK